MALKKRRKTGGKSARKTSSYSAKLVVAILAMFGVVAAYVGVVNASAVKGDEIRNLERQIAQISESVEKLSVQEAQLRAFVPPVEGDGFVKIKEDSVQVIAIELVGENVGGSDGADVVALMQ